MSRSQFLKATGSIMAKQMQKCRAANTHPCFLPLDVLKRSDDTPDSMISMIQCPFMPS